MKENGRNEIVDYQNVKLALELIKEGSNLTNQNYYDSAIELYEKAKSIFKKILSMQLSLFFPYHDENTGNNSYNKLKKNHHGSIIIF